MTSSYPDARIDSGPENDGDAETVDCWECNGEGGYHDCGEDCCMCVDQERVTHECSTCGGSGFVRIEAS